MGPICSTETSVSNHLNPRNNPEDGRIQFNRGGSVRSRVCLLVSLLTLYLLTHIKQYSTVQYFFPLQAWCGSWGSRGLRLLDRLDIRHYEGGKVITLTHRPPSPSGVFLVLIFRGRVDPRAHGSVGSSEKIPSHTTGERSRDLPTSSAVPQPLRYPRPLQYSLAIRITYLSPSDGPMTEFYMSLFRMNASWR